MQTQPVPLSPKNRLRLQAQLLDSVNQAVVATDLDGCIVFWNRFAEKLYGWTSEEALGRDVTRPYAGALIDVADARRSWRT